MNDTAPNAATRFARFLVRRQRWVLLLSVVLALVAGARMVRTYAALKSDLEELLPTSAPSVNALKTLRERVPGIRHLGVVVAVDRPDGGADAVRFLDVLATRIRSFPKSLVARVRVDSRAEREFAETYALSLMDPEDVRALREAVERRRDFDVSRKMELDLGDGDDEPRPEIPLDALMKKYEARFGKPRVTSGDHFVSADGKNAVLLVQVASHDTGQGHDAELLQRVQREVEALDFPRAFGGGLRIGYAGDVAARVEEARGLEADLTWSSVLVLLLVGGSLVWFYRSPWSIPILCIPLGVGTATAFGLVALPPLSIVALNTNTAFLGSIVIGNGINSGIVLLARFLEERREGFDVEQSISRAIDGTWKATLAASLAAAVAYGSLVFTDFRGFNQFGWIGAAGLMSCWLLNYTLLPVLTRIWGGRLGSLQQRKSSGGGVTAWTLRHARPVLFVALVASLFAGAGLARRADDWVEYDLSKLRRRDSWQDGERYWGKRMDAALGSYLTPTVVLADSDDEARAIEERLRQLKARSGAGGLIGNVRSAELFRSPERAASLEEARRLKQVLTPRMLGELPPQDKARVERALSERSLQPFSVRDIPEVLLTGLLGRDGNLAPNVLVFPKLGGGTWNAELLDTYSTDLREAATLNGVARPVAGSLLLSSDIARAMNADGPKATRISLVAVLLICWLAFRAPGKAGEGLWRNASLRYSMAAIAPLALGVLLMMGLLAWTSQRINFSNFVALPITFGVGADYSINVLRRYQAESSGSLSRALDSTGGAVTLCSATTVIGFGSLLMAQNRALFSFGVFAIAGELCCLVAAVLVLPAAFSLWSERQRPSPPAGGLSAAPRLGT
ncbi:MAG: MMPL family transporter [Polyangiaceae bacterium]